MGQILFLALALLVLSAATNVGAERRRCPATTTLATFNAALVPFYGIPNFSPQLEERLSLLIEELSNSDVDIICLQEVFFGDMQRQLYRSLRNKYPYALSALDLTVEEESLERACTMEELQQVAGCVSTKCVNLTGPELSVCSTLNCGEILEAINGRCRDCLGIYSVTGELEQCAAQPASRFETSYGLLLLSNKELKNGRASGFNSQSQIRGYLEASVDGVGNLICTHLSSLASTEVYFGPPILSSPLYPNYDQQQYDEILTLFNLVTSMETPILMGDFNNGPASPGENFAWELPFHYGLITARGFVSPYILKDGRCTFCADNPTANFPSNLVIDNIFLTTDAFSGRVISSKRFLDDSLVPNTQLPLSDHYGVVVTLKDILSTCRWWQRWLYYCPSPRLRLQPLESPQEEMSRLCL